MRPKAFAPTLAVLALAGCDVTYTSDSGNGAIEARGNRVEGKLDAEFNMGGVRADFGDGRSEVSVGGATVNAAEGDVRADFRTGENRAISITANSQ
jgi:hypothetical protein